MINSFTGAHYQHRFFRFTIIFILGAGVSVIFFIDSVKFWLPVRYNAIANRVDAIACINNCWHENLNYSLKRWKSMKRVEIPDDIRKFCDDIDLTNRSLILDCYSSMVPTLWIGKTRNAQVRLVLGLPVMLRPVQQYVKSTLTHLLRGLLRKRWTDTLIIIFLVDEDRAAVDELLLLIFRYFRRHIQGGLIDIMIPNRNFYNALNNCQSSERDNSTSGTGLSCRAPYLRWRDKQNFDYAYLMAYGSSLGHFYMQMEDDMTCDRDFFPVVFDAIENYSRHPFVLAEATAEGFRGKMFPANDTFQLAQFLLRRYDEMPCDWLYPLFVDAQANPRAANTGYQWSRKLVLKDRRYHHHDLCFHRGKFSSFKGKIVDIVF
ncbi:putative Alpha-1,3-mannosyl-glycoprotein 4-beta-N-acetylglucosaminyltransferase A [Hypsibius exemplaris]|uniref:Alpha-1,3-mannosyl-glycoprotein 4-beta-N-acetylglucosaminyltransferase A n=1 Tax=Hypsibius exemplaris TaxID=2072580 RepID=A0A1W0WNB3_HYPEX|nr:putative Alpha-1,3-mannosyl-glycoprotein 4-beta-N-acetylglucosaminyltransferase A [Hypsibius exemplaris]